MTSKAESDEKPAGLIGRLLGGGGKRFKTAKLGEELTMYYNEEVRAVAPSNQ